MFRAGCKRSKCLQVRRGSSSSRPRCFNPSPVSHNRRCPASRDREARNRTPHAQTSPPGRAASPPVGPPANRSRQQQEVARARSDRPTAPSADTALILADQRQDIAVPTRRSNSRTLSSSSGRQIGALRSVSRLKDVSSAVFRLRPKSEGVWRALILFVFSSRCTGFIKALATPCGHMMSFTVNLNGPSPWGFRISGGRDFKKAITVSKVNVGSKAELASLQQGDVIAEINGQNTADMLNVEAQNKIKNSKTQLQLLVDRPEPLVVPGQTNGTSSPEQLGGRFQEALQVSRDENQNYREYSLYSPASLSPGPYSPEPPSSPDRKVERETPTSKSVQLRSWSPVEKNSSHRLSRPLSQDLSSPEFRSNSSRTPTPGRYSPHSPIERELSASPRRNSSSEYSMQRFDRDSEVYKMIQENKESRSAPRQSNTFRMLQEVLEADEKEAVLRFPGKLSPSPPKPSSTVAGVHKYHTCEKCGTNIVTQAVRIVDDRFRHPACYTCTECGLNLKMRGHFWVGEQMFCEKHARERYQGPGSEPHAPVSAQH
ncbi:hypothetical protein AAFF_G00248530 [Aldrovandia affinis]|uniref:PDZ and LIM domain protein 2 n=1 Tax=Aldrovandia affinis TaxID=143900 RepID=A0AAD7RDE1_9TELE|nr:hypothetical protein AAFF_G00248530 [Aldrovandia affinis]